MTALERSDDETGVVATEAERVGDGGPDFDPHWSPDGDRLVIRTERSHPPDPTSTGYNGIFVIDADGRAALRHDLVRLWSAHNQARDGTTRVDSTFLEVTAVAA